MIVPILISTLIISLLSLIGIVTLFMKEKLLKKIVIILVSFSAGALLGGAFFHLLPESLETLDAMSTMIWVLGGFILFFLMEKILHWRHCHKENCPIHTFGYINLIGDAVHNLIDGLIIGSTFMTNFSLGVTTSIAIALHELPQEMGDFGVLLHSGMKKKKALIMNLGVALTAVLGGIISYYLSNIVSNTIIYLIPFGAGGFIYIAASDLIPEIRKESNVARWLLSFGVFIIGMILMFLSTLLK